MLTLALAALICQHPAAQEAEPVPAVQAPGLPARESLVFPLETRFGTVRRLTNQGENAEGYFGFDGDRITYQATFGDMECDQIFTLDLLTGARQLVSTGTGRTTCAYFMPGDDQVIFASTHGADAGCLTPPDYSMGYVWKIYPEFDLYIRDLNTGELRTIAPAEGYDAEATVSPDGTQIVFCSRRTGDLEVYSMNIDGSNVKQLTNRLGYDGGPFFSPDSQQIVWRAFYPVTDEDRTRYQTLLDQDTIEPMALQIMTMNRDGSNHKQVTHNEAANFAPYFHPSGERIIYCSNQDSPSGRDFDIYMIDVDGKNNERITFNPSFDGFPMFSPDGQRLIFASNRANASPRDTNLFIAEWLDKPAVQAEPAVGSR